LRKTKRNGIEKLIKTLNKNGYFESPGSTKYHCNYCGGLVEHCNNIYIMFKELCKKFNLDVPEDTIIICSFLHDICKVGLYEKLGNGYVYNREHPKGHTLLSLRRILKFIELTKEEEEIIKFHMGPYGSKEFLGMKGEYFLKEMTNCYSTNKIAKLFYFCDDMCSQFIEKTKNERKER